MPSTPPETLNQPRPARPDIEDCAPFPMTVRDEPTNSPLLTQDPNLPPQSCDKDPADTGEIPVPAPEPASPPKLRRSAREKKTPERFTFMPPNGYQAVRRYAKCLITTAVWFASVSQGGAYS